MPEAKVVVVIIAGGEGKRFWPLSSADRPKQFLRLFGPRSLLQETAARLQGLVEPSRLLVATGLAYARLTREHLPELPADNVVCEPVPRNTAPALALAAIHIRRRFGDVPVVVLPADHHVADAAALRAVLVSAVEHCRSFGGLLTFGIRPTRPETGYGYIQIGRPEGGGFYQVARFKEKPSLAEARELVKSGEYLWNSGMFVWRNECFLSELARHQPAMASRFEALAGRLGSGDYATRLADCYAELEPISVDHAVLERSTNARVMVVDLAWDDVGSWTALARHHEPDGSGNVVIGGEVKLADCRDCIVCAGDRPVGVVGVDNLVIAAGETGVLVCDRHRSGEVRELADSLAGRPGGRPREGPDEANGARGDAVFAYPRVVDKPWGQEIWWAETGAYLGKILEVRAGHSLSLQYHREKLETLYFLAGRGALVLDGREYAIRPGRTVTIHPGVAHRISAETDLTIYEASTAHPSDVVRLEDDYGRAGPDRTRQGGEGD